MDPFDLAFIRTMAKEGLKEYSNDPADRGGETYSGIARAKRPDSPIWPTIDLYKGRPDFPACLRGDAALNEMVKADYYQNYWLRLGLHRMPPAVAAEVFDTAVNQGSGTAAKYLQRALNFFNRNQQDYADVKVDGDLGPATQAAVQAYLAKRPAAPLVIALNVLQGQRYIDICEKDPTQEKWAFGWFSRVTV